MKTQTQVIDHQYVSVVHDLDGALDALQYLYEHARLIFRKPVHTWDDAVYEAYGVLKANNRIEDR